MRIALDATSSVDDNLSGVGVYSHELLHGLAAADPTASWDWFYRSQKFWRAIGKPKPARVTRRLLSGAWGNRAADLFHGLAQRLPEKPFRRQIATFHDLFVMTAEYSTPEFRERFTAQARHAAAGSDLIIAVSAFTASQVESLLNVPRQRIRVIHHGCVPRSLPAIPRENIVLCVGAIQKRKNQAALIRAFRAMPQGWKLVLAGSQGFDAAQTLAEARASLRANDIVMTGYVTSAELSTWYARARIFAFPSLDEGFGMPAIEAMAAGIPVIAANRSALPEVCGEAALYIDPRRDDDLADALKNLSENEDLRKDLTRRGIAHAAKFTWPRAVELTLAAYREVI